MTLETVILSSDLLSGPILPLLANEQVGLGDPLEFKFGQTFWTWVIFLVALVPMWKAVYGPITQALEERDRKVDDSISAADAARKEAEAQVAAAKAELTKAQTEARDKVAEAVERAQKQAEQELAKAKEQAQQALDKARTDIENEKRRALAEIRQEVVDLAIAAAGKVVGETVDADRNKQLVTRFVDDLSANRN